MFLYITWRRGSKSSAIFLYMWHHLITYQRLKLGYSPCCLPKLGHPPCFLHHVTDGGKVFRQLCLYVTLHHVTVMSDGPKLHGSLLVPLVYCIVVLSFPSNMPSDAYPDRKFTLGIDPRAGTNFVLSPLSDWILISEELFIVWTEYTVQKTEDIYQVIELLTDRE